MRTIRFVAVCVLLCVALGYAQPVSLPVVPAQPSAGTYGFSSLTLFPCLTRASYQAAFGVQPANWDATKPPKCWLDTSAGPDPRAYNVPDVLSDVSGAGEKPLTLGAAEAAAVNIPGLITYPAYAPAPLGATQPGAAGSSLNPAYFATMADALKLAMQWGVPASQIVNADPVGLFGLQYQATEQRRQFEIIYAGSPQNVGIALAQMYSRGIGHPGAWDFSQGSPGWRATADPPDGIGGGVAQAGSEVPVPVRALLANERLQHTLTGLEILNTGVLMPTEDGDFSAQDRATLVSLAAKIDVLQAALAKITVFLGLK